MIRRKMPPHGFSLSMLLMLILVMGVAAASIGKMYSNLIRFSMYDKQKRTATEAAASAMMDYMRDFSNSYYERHYDTLSRPAMAVGDATITFTPHSNQPMRTVYLESKGAVTSSFIPGTQRKFSALVRFQSDLTRFLVFLPLSFIVTTTGVTYQGPCYYKQNLTINGSSVLYDGGPLIVRGNLILNSSLTVDGDLYLGGTKSGPGTLTVTGTQFNYAPNIELPTLDLNYYNNYATTRTVIPIYWKFNSNGTYQLCNPNMSATNFEGTGAGAIFSNCSSMWGDPKSIPPSGAIFYAQSTNVGVWGTIARPVTIVAGANTYTNTAGRIYMPRDLEYPSGVHIASPAFSVALLAKNRIMHMNFDGGDAIAHGIFYPEGGYNDTNFTGATVNCGGGAGSTFRLYGGRFYGVSQPSGSCPGGSVYTPDPNLNAFPPPGLPEKPLLIDWSLF